MLLVLVKNEVNKILSKRKMLLITVIMLILVSLFAYGQNYQYKNTLDKYSKTTTESGEYSLAITCKNNKYKI